MSRVPNKKEIDEAMQTLVQNGLMNVVGNKDGEDQYQLTERGIRYVEAMPNKEKMQAILDEEKRE